MAMAAMVACSNDEIVDVTEYSAISFDNAFVDNSTRAAYDGSYNSGNLQAFEVYATITGGGENEGTANIFNQERVERGNALGCGTNWSYSSGNIQYWIPGNIYNFRAIADGNVADATEVGVNEYNMATSINVLDASAQKDILLAEQLNIKYERGNETKVNFTFEHLLSKVKFTIKNTITINSGYSYKVSNIEIANAIQNATYDIVGKRWAVADHTDYVLSFGNGVSESSTEGAEASDIAFGGSVESNFERLLIPNNESLTINFDYLLLKDGVVIDTQLDQQIITSDINLESGKAYNFIITLGNPGDPITFDVVEVTKWDEQAGQEI